jgi:RHS repeat-associated protein
MHRKPAFGAVFFALLAVLCSLVDVPLTQAQTPTDFFLHGTGPDNNPPTLVLNTTSPTATSAKFRDSAGVNFSGGNPWKEIGAWPAVSSLTNGTLTALSDLHVWLGLKNSDDQGTRFDMRAEVLKNGVVVSSGLTRCITGIVRNANQAKEATVTFGSFSPVPFNGTTDTLSVKLSTRIGTNPDDTKCTGHNNAVGLRLYFDATTRQARFDVTTGVVTNPLPILVTLSPSSAPVGSPTTTLTITGQSFVSGAIVQFGTTALVTTVVSATHLTATIPAALLTAKGTVPVTVENPAPGGGASNSLPFTIANGAPTLAPIGNQTVPLGSTLTFTTTATDPDNDPLTFAVTPLPLPDRATFNSQTGSFTFTPLATQVGTVTLTFVATDGILTTSEAITITVTGAPSGGVTSLTGRVDDTSQHPLDNLAVSLKGTALSTMTAADGTFILTSATMPTGRQQLVVTGLPQNFANLVVPVDIVPNVSNQLPQPLTLPPLDTATAVTVNPAATTTLMSSTLNVTVTIPPHTAKNSNGTDYTGVLTISPVPEYGRPESRPVELRPGLSVTIQPAGIVLDPPAPITFPNLDNLPPGNELDLWSLYPETGTFLQVGTARVSADGQRLETISGGVRRTAWHFALAPGVNSRTAQTQQAGPCTPCDIGSQGDLTEGALTQELVISGVRSVGAVRNLTLRYTSTSADVRPILPVDALLQQRAAVPPTFSARLTVAGTQQGNELFWNAAGLPENADSVSRLGVQFDASALATGRYPYELMLFSNYPQSSIGGARTDHLLLRNERASAFGAGWTLDGLDRLLPQSNGRLLLAQGDGRLQVYGQAGRPLVIDSFSLARSLTVAGRSTSFVAGQAHAQARADLLNPANFAPAGIVPRSVTLRTGLDTLTLDGLAGTDMFILNYPASQLTPSEVVVLEQFIAEGGALLEMRDAVSTRPLLLGTLPGSFIADTAIDITPEGAASPLGQGPFGNVGPALTMGGNGSYATTDDATVIARNDAGPNVLLFQPTAPSSRGRAVVVGDEEIFASGFVDPASNQYNNLNNRPFFLNTIAFLAGAPGFRTPLPLPGASPIFQGPPGEFSTIAQQSDGTYTRRLKDGTTYRFNAQGLQTSIADRNGNTTAYAHNGSNQLTTLTDPASQVTTLAYDAQGRLASITDPAGRVTTVLHDAVGALTAITTPDGSTETFAYDPQRRMTQRTDARGKLYQYQYDSTGRLNQVTLPTGQTRKLSPSQRLAVPNVAAGEGAPANPAPLAASVNSAMFTDANTRTTSFETDAIGRVTKQIDSLNRTTTITRDPQGNPTQITRPNGAITTMTYDARGNLLTSTEQSISATTTFTYEPIFNQVTRITDPKGNQTNITYDVKGNPLTITDADNKVTRFFYNAQGLLTETRDALYPANPATTFTYDALGRLLTTTDPLNRTTMLTYDNAGNVATSTDALSRVTTFEYDAKNRLKKVIDPLLGETVYTYDGNGNLLTVKDAKNQITTFAYDDRNRLISTTDPLGKVESYEYDGNDNLTKRTTPKLDQIIFAYDAVNQLLSKTLPGSQVTGYTYSTVGNLLTVTDPDSSLTMTYDQANRLLTTSTAGSSNQPTVTLSYTYDKNGNRLTELTPTGTNTYVYDVLNRLTNLTSPAGSFGLAYDAISRRTSLTLPNGTQTTYAYDPASQVTQILHQLTATSTQINRADYLYNGVGNRTSLTDRRGAQTFGYDNLDRLTSTSHPLLATPQSFAYDPVGNRTTGGSVVNAGNQLTADAMHSYQYDDNGNLTLKTLLATGNYTQYTYDPENRLTKVEDFAVGNPTAFVTSTYRYDGLGRRIEKVANGQTKRYIYDGEDILLEYDGSNVLQARYTHGPGIDEPIAVTKGGSTFFYHQDGLGTVTDLTDSAGATAKSYGYDAYGNILESPGTVDQPYTYTGRELDAESGLLYYRARYYDPTTGRFLQEDPIGFDGGDLNLYAYVGNNVANNRDPKGLAKCGKCWELLKKAIEYCKNIVVKKQPPRKAYDVLDKIKQQKGSPPHGHKGGREYDNSDNKLPSGKYKEYDVDPKIPGQARNDERIVLEQNTGKAYYTNDHYQTFTPLE